MDNDNDGKLNYVEFHERAYDIYKNYLEFESSGTNVPKPEEKFAELDLNKDRYYSFLNPRNIDLYFFSSNKKIKKLILFIISEYQMPISWHCIGRLLTEEELKPILRYLQPGELSYAIYYTKYLIHEVDFIILIFSISYAKFAS